MSGSRSCRPAGPKRRSGAGSTTRASASSIRSENFKKREKEFEQSRYRKERLVARARELAESNDFGSAFAGMRDLMTQWKAVGFAGNEHDQPLWRAFQAARDRLRQRADAQRQAAEYAKRRIVEEASSIPPTATCGRRAIRCARCLRAGRQPALPARSSRTICGGASRAIAASSIRATKRDEHRAQKTREFLSRLEAAASRKREALWRVENHLNDLRSRPPIEPGPRAYDFACSARRRSTACQ
jgi:hypothetical protein